MYKKQKHPFQKDQKTRIKIITTDKKQWQTLNKIIRLQNFCIRVKKMDNAEFVPQTGPEKQTT
jgi:hypothetical protein